MSTCTTSLHSIFKWYGHVKTMLVQQHLVSLAGAGELTWYIKCVVVVRYIRQFVNFVILVVMIQFNFEQECEFIHHILFIYPIKSFGNFVIFFSFSGWPSVSLVFISNLFYSSLAGKWKVNLSVVTVLHGCFWNKSTCRYVHKIL